MLDYRAAVQLSDSRTARSESSIRTLIVDDEPLARLRIREALEKIPDAETVGECADAEEAISAIRSLRPDLIFLDVQMRNTSGFDVIEALPGPQSPFVIFVTDHADHALRAFRVNALDYLLKPFEPTRLHEAFDRARRQIMLSRGSEISGRLTALIDRLAMRTATLERFIVKKNGRILLIRANEVDWIEAAGNYVEIHVGKAQYLLREALSSLEQQLDADRFRRIHRSKIVNLDRVRELDTVFNGELEVVLQDGTRLPFSRRYRHNLPELGRA